jgi:hypothetical protein
MKITGEEITGEEIEDNDYGFFCDIDIESNFHKQYIENRILIRSYREVEKCETVKKEKRNTQTQKIEYSSEKEKDKMSSFAITIYILSSFAVISLCFVV